MIRWLTALTLIAACPATMCAEERRWGLAIWGLSYHVDRSVDYNENNIGLGVRYYLKPERWFVEVDALRNSNRGLVLPASLGLEFGHVPVLRCNLSGVVALTAAYYQFPKTDSSVIKYGPVPGVAIGCGRVKTNITVILRKSSEPLAAITASWTIMF